MFNPVFFYEAGKARSGVAIFKQNTPKFRFYISTRTNNIIVKANDINYNYVTSKNIDFTQATVSLSHSFILNTGLSGIYDVYVKVLGGLKDVYSISISSSYNENVVYIPNWENFIMQFPNLYSIDFQKNYLSMTINGDLSKIPDSVEVVRLSRLTRSNNDFYLNITNFNIGSKLKSISILDTEQPLLVFGDLTHIPNFVSFFRIVQCATGSAITYTAGKVWATSFDTLNIPLPLSHTELDSLLIDMNNSITTKIGAGVIALGGYRSATSDAAVASLQAKGFTVNINRGYQILNLPFQNNFTDSGEMAMTMVAGGTSNQPTFALSGRKAGEYCAVFNGSQSIKTTTNLPINSDKVTVAFWMKTTFTGSGVQFIIDSSPNFDANNAFLVAYNNTGQLNKIQGWSRGSGYNNVTNPTVINDGVWRHFAFVIDRTQNAVNEIKCYENGVLMTVTKQFSTNNSGNFVNNILFIGQKGGSTSGFNGSLTKLKIYNNPFTASEVSTLYNSEL